MTSAHSRLGFVARHAMVIKVRGSFDTFEGHAHLDAGDTSKSSAALTIQVASITTGQEQRDAHLRTNDFFDVPTFPEITFWSTAVTAIGSDTFDMTGDLTVRGTIKPVSIAFDFGGSAKTPTATCAPASRARRRSTAATGA